MGHGPPNRHPKMTTINLVTERRNHKQYDSLPSPCGYSRSKKASALGKLLGGKGD